MDTKQFKNIFSGLDRRHAYVSKHYSQDQHLWSST